MNKNWELLLALREEIGLIYGSEDLAVLFYSLTKRERPKRIVELGTGLGLCSFWIAHALLENGNGHLWTFDDGKHFESSKDLKEQIKSISAKLGIQTLEKNIINYGNYFAAITDVLNLNKHLTLLQETIDFEKNSIIKADWSFLDRPIDWLFSDIQHGPEDVILLLAEFLPFLSKSSSIFIDSASTSLVSYLTLERTIEQLNHGRIPCQFFTERSEKYRARLCKLIPQRKFTLMHLIERKNRAQNSTAWIRIEPIDFVPHPKTTMRY
jgi:hypothetical protein